MMSQVWSKFVNILWRASQRGFWALVDQGIASLGTFLVGVMLARAVDPEEYGAYAIILGILFFLNVFHNALITYPLSIQGATLSESELGKLAGANILWTLVTSTPLSIGMAAVVLVVSDASVVPWTVLALFAWQFHETARRSLMAHLRHRDLIAGDALKFFGWAGGTGLLVMVDLAGISGILAVLFATSAAAGLIQCRQVGVRFDYAQSLMRIARDAWWLGRLVLAGGVLNFFTVQFFSWMLFVSHGLEFSARLQALVLIMGVTHPIMFGISNILIPAVARSDINDGPHRALRVGLSYGGLGGIALLPFYLVVLALPDLVLRLFFGEGSPYLELNWALRVFTASYLLGYTAQILFGLLNGLRRIPAGFISQGIGSLTSVLIGIPLILEWGVIGAVWAGVIANLAQVTAQVAFLWIPDRLPWAGPLEIEQDSGTR